MAADMREMADETGYNESQLLLNSIQEADPDAIRNLIMQLSSNLELPQNAAIDAIWKNASHNETNIETAEQKRRREVQKRLLDDNFTGKVDNEYTNSMETLGFFDLSSEQANTLLAGGADAETLLQRRAQEIGKVLQRARETNLFAIQDKYGLMEALFGKDWQSQPTELAHVLELTGDDLQVFYRELIKYSDSYTEALKRSRERQKKILDEQWMKTTTFHANEDAQKQTQVLASGVGQFSANVQQQKEAGESVPRKDTYGTASFISSMGHDPEIDSYRLKMEAAAAYYDFLKVHQADAETLRDAEQAILQSEMEYAKSVAEQMKQRINDIYELAAPIEDFGTEVGEAFATMTEDAEEGRKAMKKAIGSMIKAFMKQTVEMSKEYIKRRMMQKMNDKLTSKDMKKSIKLETGLEQDKQDAVLDVAKQGGQARTFLNEEGRCSVHGSRPAICRLFPLGRIYREDGKHRYFLQTLECVKERRTKIRIRKWMDTPEFARYEDYVDAWHGVVRCIADQAADLGAEELKALDMCLLRIFFLADYDVSRDFYEQFEERRKLFMEKMKPQNEGNEE